MNLHLLRIKRTTRFFHRPFVHCTFLLFGLGLFGDSGALAQERSKDTVESAQILLNQAVASCSQGGFAEGVKQVFLAATTIQKVDAKHPINRKWRPVLRKCLTQWIDKLGKACKPDISTLDRMRSLLEIAKQAEKVTEKAIARRALLRRDACFVKLGSMLNRKCSLEPGERSFKLARSFAKQLAAISSQKLPPKAKSSVNEAVRLCLGAWKGSASTRCQAAPTVPSLRELGAVVAASGKAERAEMEQAYEACARQMGSYAWQLCQQRKYRQGRALMKEAIARYEFHNPKDLSFLKRMKTEFMPRCGTYAIRFVAEVSAATAGVKMSMTVETEIFLAHTGSKDSLVGVLRIRPKLKTASTAKADKGKVLVILSEGTFLLDGRVNPKTRNLTWWPKGSSSPPAEHIQITRVGKAADVFKERILYDLLLQARVLANWMSVQPGAQKRLVFAGGVGGTRKGSVSGTLTMGRLN